VKPTNSILVFISVLNNLFYICAALKIKLKPFVGSGDVRQMSEYPIPPWRALHACILRRCY
jgi:hypothetical protein